MAKKSKIRNQVKYKDYVEEKQNIFTDISRLSSFKGLKDTRLKSSLARLHLLSSVQPLLHGSLN